MLSLLMQFSQLWVSTIEPILAAWQPRCIVEIGTADGALLRQLIPFCTGHGCTVHSIDPEPGPAVEQLLQESHGIVTFHKDSSLHVLENIAPFDTVLIDGDHNWYTVFHELKIIERRAAATGAFPLVILHDTGWPYGRRDMYHHPERIPAEYRKSHRRAGIVPDASLLVEQGGINATYWNAVENVSPRNGVLTAVEDFIRHSTFSLQCVNVPGAHGISILSDTRNLAIRPAFAGILRDLSTSANMRAHIDAIEQDRIMQITKQEELHTQCTEMKTRIEHMQSMIEDQKNRLDAENAKTLQVQAELRHVLGTRSWTLTLPLRKAGRMLRFLKRTAPQSHPKNARMPAKTPGNDIVPCGDYAAWIARNEYSEIESEKRAALLQDMRDHPQFSIIVPIRAFDEIAFRQTLNSITEQSYSHWQLILVNDASSQNVLRIIAQDYMQAFPTSVFYKEISGETGYARAFEVGLRAATGSYVGIVFPHDVLHPDALLYSAAALQGKRPGILYADHDALSQENIRSNPSFKPAWSPEHLLARQYIGPCVFLRRDCSESALRDVPLGKNRDPVYDLLLQIGESGEEVFHIPRVLYHRRLLALYDKPEDRRSMQQSSVAHALRQRRLPHVVEIHPLLQNEDDGCFRIRSVPETNAPLVTLIIPTKDRVDLLRRCIASIRNKTAYARYQILVIDNGSSDVETLAYFRDAPFEVLTVKTDTFNFAHINNVAARHAQSELLLFLNNDTEILEDDWLTQLVGTLQLSPRIGVVAGRLQYPTPQNGMAIQHAGMLLGRNLASLVRSPDVDDRGFQYWNQLLHNCAAVSGANLLTRKSLFQDVGGFDEHNLGVDFCDTDYCLKCLQRGNRIVCESGVTLLHHESASRGNNNGRGATLNPSEAQFFETRWGDVLERDPYFSPNLSLTNETPELAQTVRDCRARSVDGTLRAL